MTCCSMALVRTATASSAVLPMMSSLLITTAAQSGLMRGGISPEAGGLAADLLEAALEVLEVPGLAGGRVVVTGLPV